MYERRMLGYYPRVISAIQEFQAIIGGEAPEFETLNSDQVETLDNAYLLTMHEERVEQWENALGITPLADSSVDDRRDTIIARIRAQGKLNTALINAIVKAFTGGVAESYIENSVLYVKIKPPPENKIYKFPNVERELMKKKPAHLGLMVIRDYATWGEVKDNCADWNTVYELGTWGDLKDWLAPL